jgi:membrane protein
MNVKQMSELVKAAVAGWIEDRAASEGAALSYYTVFSIAPLLLIVIAVAGLVFGEEAARGAVVGQLQGMMGQQGAQAVEELVKSASAPRAGIVSTLIGFALLLVGATTVLAELQDALDRIWKAPARPDASGLWGWLRARVLSFAMILGVGFLLLVSLVFSAALAALGDWWSPLFGGWEVLAMVVNFVLSFAIVTALFALIYKFMPHVRIQWRDVAIGAAVTALLFTIGKLLIGLYIGKSGVTSGFGAAGSLVVLLLWVYYSAQIFLLGAEFTAAYAWRYGSLRHQPAPAKATAAPAAAPAGPQPAAAKASASPYPDPASVAQAAVAAKTGAAPARAPAAVRPGRVERHPGPILGAAVLAGAASAVAARIILRKRAVRPVLVAPPRRRGRSTALAVWHVGTAILSALARRPSTAARHRRKPPRRSLASPY